MKDINMNLVFIAQLVGRRSRNAMLDASSNLARDNEFVVAH